MMSEDQFKGPTYPVEVQFTISANIEEAASSIVRAGNERVTVGEELNGVDVGLVAGKGLNGLASSNIPKLSESVAGTRDKGVLVGWVEANAHDIAKMIGELGDLLAGLNVPLHASHVTRRGEDAAVVDEAAAGEVTGVTGELASDARGAIALLVEVVDGADIVEATAGNEVAARSVGAGHDPGGAQGNGVDLVGSVGVPDNELSVLRGRDKVPSVGRPVHGVDLGQMTLERPLGLHQLVLRDWLMSLLRNSADYRSDAD